jgi:hypothetical protein
MFDCIFIEVSSKKSDSNLVFGLIYRSPKYNSISQITSSVSKILYSLSKEKKSVIIAGDININLLNCESNITTAGFPGYHDFTQPSAQNHFAHQSNFSFCYFNRSCVQQLRK